MYFCSYENGRLLKSAKLLDFLAGGTLPRIGSPGRFGGTSPPVRVYSCFRSMYDEYCEGDEGHMEPVRQVGRADLFEGQGPSRG